MSNTNKKITTTLARRGFTLIESTVVLSLTLLIVGVSTATLNQQLNYYSLLQRQNFLVQDAPIINGMLSRILSQADAFQIFQNQATARAGTPAVRNGGNTIMLGYAQADGSKAFGLLNFTPPPPGADTGSLTYTNIGSDGTLSTPWTLSNRVAAVNFGINPDGILTLTLNDQFLSQITYAGVASL